MRRQLAIKAAYCYCSISPEIHVPVFDTSLFLFLLLLLANAIIIYFYIIITGNVTSSLFVLKRNMADLLKATKERPLRRSVACFLPLSDLENNFIKCTTTPAVRVGRDVARGGSSVVGGATGFSSPRTLYLPGEALLSDDCSNVTPCTEMSSTHSTTKNYEMENGVLDKSGNLEKSPKMGKKIEGDTRTLTPLSLSGYIESVHICFSEYSVAYSACALCVWYSQRGVYTIHTSFSGHIEYIPSFSGYINSVYIALGTYSIGLHPLSHNPRLNSLSSPHYLHLPLMIEVELIGIINNRVLLFHRVCVFHEN